MHTRPLASAASALLIVALAAGCSDAKRDDSGSIVDAGEVSAFDVEVGDCFGGDFGTSTEVGSVDAVPCDDPHRFEVFHAFDMEGDDDAPFPGSAAVSAASDECTAAPFEEFVGVAYEATALDVFILSPVQATWEGVDDREIVCSIVAPDEAEVTGTLEGRGAEFPLG